MQKAINIDKIAQVLEESAKKDEHNVVILGNQMLKNGKLREELDKNKIQEEQKITQLREKLRTYKSEISNCEYLLRKLREEKARNEAASDRLEEEAIEASKLAKQAKEEVKELNNELERNI